jgi:hypothetical protein
LTTLYFVDAKNTDSWRSRKGDLQRAFSPNISMVPSSLFIATTDIKRPPHDVSSLDGTICFGSLEFIADRFGGLSLSPLGDGFGTIAMSPARGEPPLL